MRLGTLWVALLVVTAGLTGCLQDGEPIEGTVGPAPDDGEPSTGDEASANESQTAGAASTGNQTGDVGPPADANETPDPSRRDAPVDDRPLAVLAHIDTGINPYHQAFRDDSPLGEAHPSEYIDGYPEDVPALNLTLDAGSYQEAVREDADVWANVTQGQLYWIPGTRIDGAISMGGGTYCPILGLPHDYVVGSIADGTGPMPDCPEERPILDDFGHGTMTASRSVGEGTSLCPDCRLVSIEGLGGGAVRWAADQGFIDVQTNSWLSLVPAPVNHLQDDATDPIPNNRCTVGPVGTPAGTVSANVCVNDTTTDAFAYAADRMVTIAASGNGAAYLAGFAPTPTYTLSTAPPGVILVGAHDNGYLASWSGSPPHVIADGYRGLAAANDSLTRIGPLKFTCCTSSSAPYAAGGIAHMIQVARDALGNTSNGIHDDEVATGPSRAVSNGPMDDGRLTVDELRTVYFHTAQLPPAEHRHDGRLHWSANPEQGPRNPSNPSGNPYCGGCLTAPVPYSQLPEEVPTYVYTGYGAISAESDQRATSALLGFEHVPTRERADAFFETDQTVRDAATVG